MKLRRAPAEPPAGSWVALSVAAVPDEWTPYIGGLDGLQGAFDSIKSGTEARTVLLPNG